MIGLRTPGNGWIWEEDELEKMCDSDKRKEDIVAAELMTYIAKSFAQIDTSQEVYFVPYP